MPVNSKAKGARFERQLARMFREYGFTDARRTAQYCGNTGDAADVVGLPKIHVEAKHAERMRLYDWMAQAVRDAQPGEIPAVFHKANGKGVLVTIPFDDFMRLYKAAMDDTTDLMQSEKKSRCTQNG